MASFQGSLQGEKHDHFIWETLNTEEATYIWHFPKIKDLKTAFDKIESTVKTIKVNGKMPFIGLKNEFFTRVNHNYAEGIDGFVDWKSKLEAILN